MFGTEFTWKFFKKQTFFLGPSIRRGMIIFEWFLILKCIKKFKKFKLIRIKWIFTTKTATEKSLDIFECRLQEIGAVKKSRSDAD